MKVSLKRWGVAGYVLRAWLFNYYASLEVSRGIYIGWSIALQLTSGYTHSWRRILNLPFGWEK